MQQELKLVAEFHKKIGSPVLLKPSLINKERSDLRYKLMKEEVEEYILGVENQDLENIAKELADILYTVYGTILEHGLQDKMKDIFVEVHRSNMSKLPTGLKAKKGENYLEADIASILQNES